MARDGVACRRAQGAARAEETDPARIMTDILAGSDPDRPERGSSRGNRPNFAENSKESPKLMQQDQHG
jgi:hypothetical protein